MARLSILCPAYRNESVVRAQFIAAAYLLDWLIGDPEELPHPVRLFGKCIAWADQSFQHDNKSSRYQLATGGALAAGLPITTSLAAIFLNKTLRKQPFLRCGIEVALAASCLATRNLLDECNSVIAALEVEDLPTARIRVARIVGRDTHLLNASGVSRAVIETLAESLCDGVIAPLFYLTLGGVPAGLAYKAINTMDSMIGHKSERYLYFGRVAARLDDVANFIPSRITALLLCTAAIGMPQADSRRAWRTWLTDGDKHESPNSGQPESAMAGVLGVRLGGASYYKGERTEIPVLGEHYDEPTIEHARSALKVTAAASILGCGIALLYIWKKR
jgi:adenosylcobinamide-phosphate synthase